MIRILLLLNIYYINPVYSQPTIQSGEWSNVEFSVSGTSPTARHENGFVEVSGKFYLLGGRTVRTVDIFNPATKIWTLGAASPLELNHFQAEVYNNEIYAIGAMRGSYPNEVPVDNIYKYNPQSNAWSVGALIPANRRRGSAGVVLHNNKFYIVGGIQNGHIDGWVPWVDEYDPATGIWKILPDAPVARDHFMATLINGKIYAAGGRQTHYPDYAANTIGRVDVYDIATQTWSTPTQIPTQRGAPGVAYINGELVIAGGEILSSGSALTVVEAYNPVTNTWQTKPSLNVGRHATQMISYQGKLFLCAGSTSRGGSGQTNTMSSAVYFSPGVGQQTISFSLINANNEQEIQIINPNAPLNLSSLPTQSLNIRANTSPVTVGSVVFALTGKQTRNSTETSAPYALFGDVSGNYNSWTPALGSYTLKCTPFSGSGGGGTSGTPLTLSFTVINQASQQNRPPVIAKPDNITLNVGQSWNYQVIASDPDAGAVLTYSAINLPPSLTINASSGIISGNFTAACSPQTVDLTVRDQQNLSATASFVITVGTPIALINFTLINANNEQDIQTINSNTTLNLASLSTQNLNIRANTSPATVGSILFVLTGPQNRNQTESGVPYALFGDSNGNYNSWTPALGSYFLKATPYSASGGGGIAGTSLTINFNIVNQTNQTSATFEEIPSEISVYPNPVQLHFLVKFSVNEKSDWTPILYNTLGYGVQLPKVILEKGIRIVPIDLTPYNLVSGLYYLIITNSFNKKKTARVIIE